MAQLKAMTEIAPGRKFAYWSALSYAEEQIGQHEAAEADAKHAEVFAANDTERDHARELAYMARTELTVRFATDANGQRRMVTTRVQRHLRLESVC